MARRSTPLEQAITKALRWVGANVRHTRPNPQTAYGLTLLAIYAPESIGLGRTTPEFRNQVRLGVLNRFGQAALPNSHPLRNWDAAAARLIEAERRTRPDELNRILSVTVGTTR